MRSKSSKPCKKKINKKLSKRLRVAVWDKHFDGQRYALCYVCNRNRIAIEDFECAHIKARFFQGEDTCENLVPCCSLCNKSMSTRDLSEFKNELNTITHKSYKWFTYILIALIILIVIAGLIFIGKFSIYHQVHIHEVHYLNHYVSRFFGFFKH